MPDKSPLGRAIRKIAGSQQLVVENATGLSTVLSLDPALWAVMGMPTDAVIFDDDFMNFIDSDHNKRIRPAELKAAIAWLLDTLRDYSGIDQHSDVLHLSALNPNSTDARDIASAITLMLNNLGKGGETQISLTDIQNRNSMLLDSMCNGDGVIPFEQFTEPALADYVSAVKQFFDPSAVSMDATGHAGINRSMLEQFQPVLVHYMTWQQEGLRPDVTPFGPQSAKLYASYHAISSKLDDFFRFCGLMGASGTGAFASAQASLNVFDRNAMNSFLENAPISSPVSECILKTSQWINPLWESTLKDLMKIGFEVGLLAEPDTMSLNDWASIRKICSAYEQWLNRKPTSVFDGMTPDALERFQHNSCYESILKMIDEDLRAQREISAYDSLRKLVLYQKYMLDFVNNFVSLEKLFDPEVPSLIQPGKLILDSRHFSLVSKVPNLQQHKKIIERSDICVVYADLTSGQIEKQSKMTIAAAITGGTMRNLFIGKSGVFIDNRGAEWDARIIDMIQQPVSLKEALQSPFYRFGEFVGRQVDRFLSSRSKEVESSLSADKVMQTQQKTDPKNPPVNTPMMLMGGGVGLAAIGSSFAFLVNSLKNTPLLSVLGVLFGIIFVLSAPMLLVAIIKLSSRSVSDFLSASGWAINPNMRLSHAMGLIFTQKPLFPLSIPVKRGDLVMTFSKTLQSYRTMEFWRRMIGLATAGVLCLAVWWFRMTIAQWIYSILIHWLD